MTDQQAMELAKLVIDLHYRDPDPSHDDPEGECRSCPTQFPCEAADLAMWAIEHLESEGVPQ